MKTIIQMSEAWEVKALPLLLRHFPGTVLPNRIYVISEEVAKTLREAGIQFTELSRGSTLHITRSNPYRRSADTPLAKRSLDQRRQR